MGCSKRMCVENVGLRGARRNEKANVGNTGCVCANAVGFLWWDPCMMQWTVCLTVVFSAAVITVNAGIAQTLQIMRGKSPSSFPRPFFHHLLTPIPFIHHLCIRLLLLWPSFPSQLTNDRYTSRDRPVPLDTQKRSSTHR